MRSQSREPPTLPLSGPDQRRWLTLAVGLAAAGASVLHLARWVAGTPDPVETAVFLLSLGYLGLAPRLPVAAGAATVLTLVAQQLYSLAISEAGLRAPASLVLPLVVFGAALLRGVKAAWLAAAVLGLAAPVATLVGQASGGRGLPLEDIAYWVLLEVALFATAGLVTALFRTLAAYVERERAGALRVEELLAGAPDGMVATDASGVVLAFNGRAEEFFGLARGDVLGRPITSLPGWLWPEPGPLELDALGSAPELSVGDLTLEARVRRTRVDEEGRPLEWLYVLRDVTDRRRAEEDARRLKLQLEHAQRLEAVGQLAGGVAHDFNNLLTAVAGCAYVLKDSAEPTTRELADELEAATERGATLTRQLLTFARRDVVQARTVDVGKVLDGSRRLLGRLLGEQMHLELTFEPGCTVRLDEGQLEQVVWNLAANARDATGGAGRFSVRVARAGDRVVLEAEDDGAGMDAATQARAFEPFFSTKERSKGTGLGLSTVHGIVTQWAGTIAVTSAPGHGACFRIEWPFAEREDAPAQPSVSRPPVEAMRARLLLVEDDEHARRFMERLLRRHGYELSVASCAEEALAQTAAGFAPEVLVSDVIMPGMTGVELARRLREERPRLPVLLVSGYLEEVLERQGLDQTRDLLLKPFQPAEFIRRVREKVLEGRALLH
jgi:signal transduction histidine kinase/CheY-like chemotaxis protein